MQRLRGEVHHLPLTRHEYLSLYHRALTNSRKEAAALGGISDTSERHATYSAFHKLRVDHILEAFRSLGWLKPLTWEEFQTLPDEPDDDPRPYVPWP